MTTFSESYALNGLKEHPNARLYVCRNNGHCWGRVVTPTGAEFDVTTRRDWYDRSDDDAAEAFARKARRPGGLEPPTACWRLSEINGISDAPRAVNAIAELVRTSGVLQARWINGAVPTDDEVNAHYDALLGCGVRP